MRGIFTWAACAATALIGSASAASYDTIADIEVYGQHFFYTNNGTQFYFKGVAYQQNYSPNGTASTNTTYTDPLADSKGCARDIPLMKQLGTNIIRVYAIDPTQNHDDCMSQLASAGIYVIADLGEPSTSIESGNPQWDVTLYNRYTSVIDALQKYKNVVGFFAGNENVSAANETAAAAFVKAAIRDTKQYISSQNYRKTLGVGYATADVPTRNQLAAYFACQPGNEGNKTSIDFWGYNVYSWCGLSSYEASSYNERVQFFSNYPVPVFFAEYGCNQGLPGGPTSRPFTEVAALYGSNMTGVFSGGIVYEWFMGANEFGLVSLTNNDASASPYPDFTSLSKQLASVSPTVTQKSNYKPSNTPPACPSVGGSWAAQASPLPPTVNPQLCSCMAASLQCNVKTTNEDDYAAIFNYICGIKGKSYCNGITHNATTGAFGGYSGCDPKEQLGFVLNQYYLGQNKAGTACDFSGKASVQTASTASSCVSILSVVGANGQGTVPTATGRGAASGGAGGSSSKGAASGMYASQTFLHGGLVLGAWFAVAVGSLAGMLML